MPLREAVEAAIEALLFVASEALDAKRIAKLTGEDERAVALALQALEERYSNGGIVLRQIAGGYRLATSSAVRDVVEAYLLPPKTTLSTPALEALAIVAHMQPVTKGEIEAIRGVNSDSVVSTLLDRGLIAEAGRKDVVGRPMTYKTTPLFLESFGLRSLDDLPQLELEPGQPLELNLILPAAAPTSDVVRCTRCEVRCGSSRLLQRPLQHAGRFGLSAAARDRRHRLRHRTGQRSADREWLQHHRRRSVRTDARCRQRALSGSASGCAGPPSRCRSAMGRSTRDLRASISSCRSSGGHSRNQTRAATARHRRDLVEEPHER